MTIREKGPSGSERTSEKCPYLSVDFKDGPPHGWEGFGQAVLAEVGTSPCDLTTLSHWLDETAPLEPREIEPEACHHLVSSLYAYFTTQNSGTSTRLASPDTARLTPRT
jgi:hypothetical protein